MNIAFISPDTIFIIAGIAFAFGFATGVGLIVYALHCGSGPRWW